MRGKLLIIVLVVLMLAGSPAAQEVTPPDDMEFIEFLGTFEKDSDIQMMASMPELKNVPPQSQPETSSQVYFSYEKKNTQEGDDEDE
jgi:hypothetical protein